MCSLVIVNVFFDQVKWKWKIFLVILSTRYYNKKIGNEVTGLNKIQDKGVDKAQKLPWVGDQCTALTAFAWPDRAMDILSDIRVFSATLFALFLNDDNTSPRIFESEILPKTEEEPQQCNTSA